MTPLQRVVLYGGAFNPPHLAHIFTVTYLLGRDDVDAVWLIPTANHVFGKAMVALDARVEMLNEVIAAYGWRDRVRVLDIEAHRDGPSRTFDTLTELSSKWANHEFRWVMGADNLTERHRWYRFDDLIERWNLIVLGRPGHDAALSECAQHEWCQPGPTLPDVSSTQLRDAIAGVGPQERLAWLPDCVRERCLALYRRDSAPLPSVTILGLGRLGRTWSTCLAQAGQRAMTWNRSAIDDADLTGELPESIESDVILITVSDTAIEQVAEALSLTISEDAPPTVLHCAGRLGNEVLASLSQRGCPVGSLHPLQSVTGGPADLYGSYCALSGDEAAIAAGHQLLAAAGAVAFELPNDDKAAYHAAAVLSANFVTTLAQGGVDLLTALEVPERQAAQVLHPLANGTIQHLEKMPPADALTGPFARRDLDAVRAHIAALGRHAPHLIESYRALARSSARMMMWSEEERAALDEALAD